VVAAVVADQLLGQGLRGNGDRQWWRHRGKARRGGQDVLVSFEVDRDVEQAAGRRWDAEIGQQLVRGHPVPVRPPS